jgi:aminopeptidase N
VYLGYRLGHIKGDDQIFRAVVYNKGAMVLHMLRGMLGDEAFFAGLRSFYAEWKFRKAGTDDFRVTMEKASGRDLRRYFDTWVYGSSIPRIAFSYRVGEDGAQLRFEQRGDPVDVPITVTIAYASGETEDLVVVLGDKLTERTVPVKGAVRSIVANGDSGALVEIEK